MRENRARVLQSADQEKTHIEVEGWKRNERDDKGEETRREMRVSRITVVVNDERGVPVAVITGKLRYYEGLAKKA